MSSYLVTYIHFHWGISVLGFRPIDFSRLSCHITGSGSLEFCDDKYSGVLPELGRKACYDPLVYLCEKLGQEFLVFYDPAQSKAKTWVMTISETSVSHRRLIEARATHQITCQKLHPSLCKKHPAVDTGRSLKEGHVEGQRQEWGLWFNHQWGIKGLPRWCSDEGPTCQCQRHKRHGFHPWVRKIPWRRKRQPTPVLLPKEFHELRILAGYSPWGCKGSDVTEHTCVRHQGLWSLTFWFNTECDDMGMVI